MKLAECNKLSDTLPLGDPRRKKALDEKKRIEIWMKENGYGNNKKRFDNTASNKKKMCSYCGRITYPIPPDKIKCSGCGKPYNNI